MYKRRGGHSHFGPGNSSFTRYLSTSTMHLLHSFSATLALILTLGTVATTTPVDAVSNISIQIAVLTGS